MRELTLQGFLREYLRYLGDSSTLSLKRLATAALPNRPRVAEPLYLYAALTDQRERLVQVLADEALLHKDGTLGSNPVKHYHDEFEQLNKQFPQADDMIRALEANDPTVPARYQKVFDSYITKKESTARDRRYIERIHSTIAGLQRDLGVSNYRLYKDLGLNPGNINAYLKHGDTTKLSRKTASRLLDYLVDLKSQRQC